MTESITKEISDRICQHMNEDHSDAITLYAQFFGQLPQVTQAEMLSIDSLGMDLKIEPSVNVNSIRIEFDHPLKDSEDAHHTLIEMVKKARQSLRSNSVL